MVEQYGQGKVPQATHEALAEQWARNRGRLFDARSDASRAQAALADAERAEQESWDALAAEAGRGPVPVWSPSLTSLTSPRR